MDSLLSGPVVEIQITSASEQRSITLHKEILLLVPFFESQQQRWTSGNNNSLSVKLPDGTTAADFLAFCEHLYRTALKTPAKASVDALHLVQVAEMLGCDSLASQLMEDFRSSIRSEADVSDVIQACRNIEPPVNLKSFLAKLNDRKGTSKKENDMELEMIKESIDQALERSSDMHVKVISKMLKQRSRSGTIGEDEVGRLCKHGIESAIRVHKTASHKAVGGNIRAEFQQVSCYDAFAPKFHDVTLQFVTARSRWFVEIARSLLNPPEHKGGRWKDTPEMRMMLNKLLMELVHIGVEHVAGGGVSTIDFTSLFTDLIKKTPCMLEPSEDAAHSRFASDVGRLPGHAQVNFFCALADLEDQFYKHLVYKDMLGNLCFDARDVCSTRVSNFGIVDLQAKVTLPVLSLFSEGSRRAISHRMLPILPQLPDDMQEAVQQNLCISDSDEGF